MADEYEVQNEQEVLPEEDKPVPAEKFKSKECRVVRYVPRFGILGFDFDGVPCQITVKPYTDIGNTVTIRYKGNIKTGIEFKI